MNMGGAAEAGTVLRTVRAHPAWLLRGACMCAQPSRLYRGTEKARRRSSPAGTLHGRAQWPAFLRFQ